MANKKSKTLRGATTIANKQLPPVRELTPAASIEIRSTPREMMSLWPLDTFAYEYPGARIEISFTSDEFTAICPFSDFPDFATLHIHYVPNQRCIELKSLKLYINSFRETKIFHEHVVNQIRDDFVRACDPLELHIEGDFNVRGNIKTMVRASYVKAERPKPVDKTGKRRKGKN